MIIISIIIRIAKAHSIWIFEVGTFRGHKPIIDQSCGAILFLDRAHRDLSVSNLPRLIQWICDPVMAEIRDNLKSPTSAKKNLKLNKNETHQKALEKYSKSKL